MIVWLLSSAFGADVRAQATERLLAGDPKGALTLLVGVDETATVPEFHCVTALASYRLDQVLAGDAHATRCDRDSTSAQFGRWEAALTRARAEAQQDLLAFAASECAALVASGGAKSTCNTCALPDRRATETD